MAIAETSWNLVFVSDHCLVYTHFAWARAHCTLNGSFQSNQTLFWNEGGLMGLLRRLQAGDRQPRKIRRLVILSLMSETL